MKHLLFISIILLSTGCRAEEAKKEEPLYSPPFIVIDLDGDGVDFIPLEESEAYFDVDGDGEKEHTAWIKKGNAFFLSYTVEKALKIQNKQERIFKYMTGGFLEIMNSDMDSDQDYDNNDMKNIEKLGGNLFLKVGYVDRYNVDGTLFEGKSVGEICTSPTTIEKDNHSNQQESNSVKITATGKLVCSNATYPLYEIEFSYEEISNQ